MALAPRIGAAGRIHHEGSVLAALDLDDRLHLITCGRILDPFRSVAGLIITKTQLPVDIETPGEEYTLVRQGSDVAEARSALDEILALLRGFDLDLLRKLLESLVLGAKLPKAGLTPAPNVTILSNRQAEKGAASDVVDGLPVEGLDVLRGTSDLHALADTELALESTPPCIDVSLVSEDQAMVFTTSDLDDTLVSQRFQNRRGESTPGSTMPDGALDTGAIGEDVTISGQVEGVVTAALHEHEMAHVFMLLSS